MCNHRFTKADNFDVHLSSHPREEGLQSINSTAASTTPASLTGTTASAVPQQHVTMAGYSTVNVPQEQHQQQELEHHQQEPEHQQQEPEHQQQEPEHQQQEPEHQQQEPEHQEQEPEHQQQESEHQQQEPQHQQQEPEHQQAENNQQTHH
ncbi:ataxin-8-like [Sycon ciliatum]|uniref:ataxin-8-like n=1 Tax=Sycon ciliatum TaxID=27933 RepID=UPI0031F62AE7